MKRIINGITYNTDTSSVIALYQRKVERGDITIYQSRGGLFFSVQTKYENDNPANPPHATLSARTHDEIRQILETDADHWTIVDENVLKPVRHTEIKPEAAIYIRVPHRLKQRLDEEARQEEQSTNAFALRCIERCLDTDRVIGALVQTLTHLRDADRERMLIDNESLRSCIGGAVKSIENALHRLGVDDTRQLVERYGPTL